MRAGPSEPGCPPAPIARRIVVGIGCYLVLTWSLVVLIDVFDVAGTRERLVASGLDWPHLWVHLFREGSPTEWLQWALLATTALVAAAFAGWSRAAGFRGPERFWAIYAIAAALLLIEDAGNPRHRLTGYVESLVDGFTTTGQNLVELVYFAALAAVPLYALVRYGTHVWGLVRMRRYLLGGIAGYAVAALASATRHLGDDWYERFGDAVLADRLFGGRLVPFEDLDLGTGYWLMDYLVEESVELVGAACLCAAVVAAVEHERAGSTARGAHRRPDPRASGA